MKGNKAIYWGICLGLLGAAPAPVYSAPETEALPVSSQFPSFAGLVESLMPSVVNISTKLKNEESSGEEQSLPEASPEFRRYFENDGRPEALGSGFIIDEKGYILTNNHVVSDAAEIVVILADNSRHQAKIIGRDPKTDLALIKIVADKKLSPVVFGDSDRIRVGEWILAIGNPFGLGGSVTAGIVSAKSRDIEAGQYDDFIQTDAAINQGSSGGPMFNMQGEVIGVNSAIFSTTGASMGIGFAIPSNIAEWVALQLKKYGEIKRGWIGIKIQPYETENSEKPNGVLVSDVTVGAPAQRAGLAAGDILVAFNGQNIINTKDFSRRIAEAEIGSLGKIVFMRAGQKKTAEVEIKELKENIRLPEKPEEIQISRMEGDEYLIPSLGLKLSPLSDKLTKRYGLPPLSGGMVVTGIEEKADAAAKGLKVGDVIIKIDKKDITDIESVKTYVNEAKMENNRPVLVLFQNGENVHFAVLKLPEGDN